MWRITLIIALMLTAARTEAQALDRLSRGEIILRVTPGAIMVGQNDSCIVQDPGIAALVPEEGSLRWIAEFTPGAGNAFVFTPIVPEDRSVLLSQLGTLPAVLLAEPNAFLRSDEIPETTDEPSDFYFRANYWPYPPFSNLEGTGLRAPGSGLDWTICSINGYFGGDITPSPDPNPLPDQWHLQMTQTNLAWLVEDGDPSVKVAIIDSGVDWHHPDLAPNIWQNLGEDANASGHTIVPIDPQDGYSAWKEDPGDLNEIDDDGLGFGYPDDIIGLRIHSKAWQGPPTLPMWDPNTAQCGSPVDVYGNGLYGKQGSAHGTQMASIFGAAHNGFGCVGMCPRLSIIPISAGWSIESSDALKHYIGVDEMVSALDYAMVVEADIINISLSYLETDHGESQALREKLDAVQSEGIIVCCSAGNNNDTRTHWPAAWESVICSAIVAPDYVKAHQSSFAPYVDFCAPSGQKCADGEQDCDPPPEWSGDEFMAAVVWGAPDPWWPWLQLPHTIDEAAGVTTWADNIHTYKQLDGDTSGGAAQLSGAFALLKAHYPNHSREGLIAEMVRGAVDVDPYQVDPEVIGKLGNGLINPYRSLTEWGGPRASEIADGVVTWSGDIWVSGDYVVPTGCRLEVLPGTTVHIANFDNEHLGANPDKIEISASQIYANGTLEAPIRFVPFGPASEGPGAWRLKNPSQLATNAVQLQHCEFLGIEQLAILGSSDPQADSSFIEDCHFTSPASGETATLQLSAAEVRSSIFEPAWSTYCTGIVLFEACRVERPAEAEGTAHGIYWNSGGGGAKCVVENCIFRNVTVGIRMVATATDSLILENVLIEHAVAQGPPPNRGEIGIDIQGGRVKAKNLTLRGFEVGVSTQAAGRFEAEYSSFTDCMQAAVNQMGDNLMFFGYYVEPNSPLNRGGHNVFLDNEQYNIFNRHRTWTVSARWNWWGSPSGPPAGSNVGRVDVTNHLLADPGLPPPPDFIVVAEETSPPFSVGRNVPNPFNPVTAFTLTIPRGGGLVRATVFDIRGRAVRRLLNEVLPSGEHRIEFNGRNDVGEALPSGMYLCRFNFRDREEVVKATLVK